MRRAWDGAAVCECMSARVCVRARVCTLVRASFLAIHCDLVLAPIPCPLKIAVLGFSMSPGSQAVRNPSSAESEVPCWYLWFTSAIS